MTNTEYAKAVSVAVTALRMGLELVAPKGLFGSLKPTPDQIGYCFGFCDAVTQRMGFDDTQCLAFVCVVFDQLFGTKRGAKYVGDVVNDQGRFLLSIKKGGDECLQWMADPSKTPIPPLREP